MGLRLAGGGIALGIVVADSEEALGFYRDFLGLEHVEDLPMPIGSGGTMHRLQCGDSQLKLVRFDEQPPSATGRGIDGALGYRYVTLSVTNLDEMAAACADAGVPVATPVTEIRPGVRVMIIEDPDGNWVELIERAG